MRFKSALGDYYKARIQADRLAGRTERQREVALQRLDGALDSLMEAPSPSLGAFNEKIRILEVEYGSKAQPRHIGAIYADVGVLAAIYADTIFQAWGSP